MYNIEKICVNPTISLCDAIKLLDQSGRQILLVIDDSKKLIGTLTDGDLRRSFLKGYNLKDSIQDIYNKSPYFTKESLGRGAALQLMREHGIDQVPVVNDEGIIVGLEVFNSNIKGIKVENPVVIMAGGLGKRLYPITLNIPKALTPISDKPILEIIVNKFITQGFSNFIFSVNYKAEMIQNHFKDGSEWNVSIGYIHENKKLGTVGALSKLSLNRFDLPIVVMNCDILTTENFQHILEYHEEKQSVMTIGVRKVSYEIPYGVAEVNNDDIIKISEKPTQTYHINAGIYVINPTLLEFIPKNTFFNMTDLIDIVIKKKLKVSAFPINGYWIDIGRMEDLEKVRIDSESLNLF
jgi:dTDP-glucose pyrophosphorylase/CBS domain-containing protein